jgi:hypothetical protein
MGKNKNIEVSDADAVETPRQEKNLVDLTGHWFVNFGADMQDGKMEGCRILTLNGSFDPDTFIDVLVDSIQQSLPQEAKDVLAESKQRIIIRAFNRIDNPGVVTAVTI